MRIFILGDTHFGIYPVRTDKWLSMMTDYFHKSLIPFFKKYVKPGDVLVHLGDVYDKRLSINVKVNKEVVKLFYELSNIFSKVYILNGNHDNYNTNYETNVTSTISIKHIKNVHIIYAPTQITHDDKRCVLLPWIENETDLKKMLDTYSGSDILFCHSDLNGCRTQVNPTRRPNQTLLDIECFGGYKKVYSGHIHIRQTIGNFHFVGTPYHLDRNDKGNEKGIHVYDTRKDDHVFVKNDISPEFKSVMITVQDDLFKVTNDLCNNNYVDLYINNSLRVSDPTFVIKVDKILANRKIESVNWIEEDLLDESVNPLDANIDLSWDILELCKQWVEDRQYDSDAKADRCIKDGTMSVIVEADKVYKKMKLQA